MTSWTKSTRLSKQASRAMGKKTPMSSFSASSVLGYQTTRSLARRTAALSKCLSDQAGLKTGCDDSCCRCELRMAFKYASDGIRSPEGLLLQLKKTGKSSVLLFQRSSAARRKGGRHDDIDGVMLASLQPRVDDMASRCCSVSASPSDPSRMGVSVVLLPSASWRTQRRLSVATESTRSHSSMKMSFDIFDVFGDFSVGLSRTWYDSSPLSLSAYSSYTSRNLSQSLQNRWINGLAD